jgi:hypothetical protein
MQPTAARAITYESTVATFLFSKPAGMYFSSIIWTQWPDRADVFGMRTCATFWQAAPLELFKK